MKFYIYPSLRPVFVANSHAVPLIPGARNPSRQKPKRRWNLGQYAFVMLATICLGIYGYAYLERILYQTYEGWSFDRTTARSTSPVVQYHEATMVGDVVSGPQRSMPPSEAVSPSSIVGRLSVPRLHLSAMVREGIDGKTLQLAVGHIPLTALPGEAGNVGVAGHRDTFFRGLKDLRATDEIQFSTSTGNFSYEVESLMVVEPDNVEVLAASSTNTLTLVTCYPFSYIGSAPKRFIVKARQVSPQTPSLSNLEKPAEFAR
jgi:sortase A